MGKQGRSADDAQWGGRWRGWEPLWGRLAACSWSALLRGATIESLPGWGQSGDPNYVHEEHNPGAGRGSPRKSMDPNVDAANQEAVSYAPRSGKPDTHSAFNEKNFFAVPTPVLTEEDLAKDA